MSESAAIAQRARTDEQKQVRRQMILDAADDLFDEVGFEAFSMAEVGRRAGVVKGTLYLYFETREEVLLSLHCEKLAAWRIRIEDELSAGLEDRDFVRVIYDTAYADPGFLILRSRLGSVIEHNVSHDTLIDAKRFMAREFTELAQAVAERLNLSADQSFQALSAFASLLLGVSQVDSGPELDESRIPEDVLQFMQAFSSRELFESNARHILVGIRNEEPLP